MVDLRIRRDVWKLDQWDPILLWYARAVAEMQKRPLNDPTGWRYQAAVHDYIREQDPLASPADVLPSAANQQRFWRQCQHFSWFFLPWHRMYLAIFEEIVADTIVRLGGPAGWALPYWNYSNGGNPDARRLPPAFREAETPDGAPNPLRVERRNPGCNVGAIIADENDVSLRACLMEPVFAADGVRPSFGGPRTGFNHSGGTGMGQIDRIPHGAMHVAVGGWMGRFNTAGLDPIFWLHHANIDRLWTVWLRRDPQHRNPSESRWATGLSFEFNDATGNAVSFTSSQVADTTALSSPYRYEDETDPLGAAAGPEAESADVARRRAMTERRIPEMVGATEEPIVLAGRPASTQMSASRPTGPARAEAGVEAAPAEIYLNVENITGTGEPTSYSVYLNLPDGADPADHPELLAGTLPMFGVSEASRPGENHAGSGLTYALEVGDVVRTLQARDDWNPDDIRLTFVPKLRGPAPETAMVEAAESPIRVGRVSLYVG